MGETLPDPDGDWCNTHPDHVRADITRYPLLEEAGIIVAITASRIYGLFWFTKILRLDEQSGKPFS